MGAPVILCGKTEPIGKTVIETLKPECDGKFYLQYTDPGISIDILTYTHPVIHFVMTPHSGTTQIPAILKGEKSISADSELGSKDYTKPPVAVIFGGGYTDADIELMFNASAGIRPIPWLRPDLTKPAPPLGPEYDKAMVKRIKELLVELEKEGKMNDEQVVWY